MTEIYDKLYEIVNFLADHYGFDTDEAIELVEDRIDDTLLGDPSKDVARVNTNPHEMFISLIHQQVQKEKKQNIWENSPYKDLVKLQSNNVGNVGEDLLNGICEVSGIPACCDGSKTKKIGGGDGDGNILDMSIEIKTAHQGSTYKTFQHELGEVPWKSKFMLLVDVSPQCIYLTIFRNFDEETYKSGKKLPRLFKTKQVTWRKKKGAFKLDTSVSINEKNIVDGNTIKITPASSNEDVALFIRKMIVD